MPRVGFESMIPVSERVKTVHALDRSATAIGHAIEYIANKSRKHRNTPCGYIKVFILGLFCIWNRFLTTDSSHWLNIRKNSQSYTARFCPLYTKTVTSVSVITRFYCISTLKLKLSRMLFKLHRIIHKIRYIWFKVLTAVVMKSTIFWDISPCSPLEVKRRLGRTYRLHLQGRISRATPWRWRRYVPPKHRLTFKGLQGVISQKTVLFKTKYTYVWND
jgi:hypothetical protein